MALKKGLDRLAVDLANPELKVRPHLPPYLPPCLPPYLAPIYRPI